MCRDRAAARRSLDRVLGWEFDRVVVGHGAVVEHDGKRLAPSFCLTVSAAMRQAHLAPAVHPARIGREGRIGFGRDGTHGHPVRTPGDAPAEAQARLRPKRCCLQGLPGHSLVGGQGGTNAGADLDALRRHAPGMTHPRPIFATVPATQPSPGAAPGPIPRALATPPDAHTIR
jgi:hypothetical protein